MNKTTTKYQIKDRGTGYQILGRLKLEDKYTPKVAKSHDRKIKKVGLPAVPTDQAS